MNLQSPVVLGWLAAAVPGVNLFACSLLSLLCQCGMSTYLNIHSYALSLLQGMIQQLIDYNLRHGALSVRNEVRTLLCLLTRDNRRGTEEMNNLVMTRITAAIKGHQSNPDLV